MTIEIKTNQLSKTALAKIVDILRPYPITDKSLAVILRLEMISSLCSARPKLKKIKKGLGSKKHGRKSVAYHNKVMRRYNSLWKRCLNMAHTINLIELQYPELIEKEPESCQET